MNHKWTTFGFVMVGLIVAIVLVGLLYVDQAVQFQTSLSKLSCFLMTSAVIYPNGSDPIGDWSIDQGNWLGMDGEVVSMPGSMLVTLLGKIILLQAKVIFVNSNANLVLRSTGHWQDEYRLDFWQQGGENSNSYQVSKYQDGVVYELSGGLVPSPVSITNPSVSNGVGKVVTDYFFI